MLNFSIASAKNLFSQLNQSTKQSTSLFAHAKISFSLSDSILTVASTKYCHLSLMLNEIPYQEIQRMRRIIVNLLITIYRNVTHAKMNHRSLEEKQEREKAKEEVKSNGQTRKRTTPYRHFAIAHCPKLSLKMSRDPISRRRQLPRSRLTARTIVRSVRTKKLPSTCLKLPRTLTTRLSRDDDG